jgi:uncharacterized protein YkwD
LNTEGLQGNPVGERSGGQVAGTRLWRAAITGAALCIVTGLTVPSASAPIDPPRICDPALPGTVVVPGLGNVAGLLHRPAPRQTPSPKPVTAESAPEHGSDGTDPDETGSLELEDGHQWSDSNPSEPSRGQNRAAIEAQLLASTNQARAANGCSPVQVEPHLQDSAQQHAYDMADHEYFSHTSLDGRTFDERIHQDGYAGAAVGENIASGFGSPNEVQAAWMDSTGHRENIVDCTFRNIGIGFDSNGGYWTVDFGG